AELSDDGAARALAVSERARARHLRGDLDGALALLRELVPATAPDAALKLRAEIEESRGTLAEAAPALEELRARAAAARDESIERWATRRLLRVAAAMRSGASEELARRALELDPDDRDAAVVLNALDGAGWVLLGGAYETLGDGERAAAAYQRAGDAAPPKKRAEAAFRAGRAAEARTAAIEALARDPRDADALGWATHGLSPAAV